MSITVYFPTLTSVSQPEMRDYVADTEAEKPTTIYAGSRCYVKATDLMYIGNSAGQWVAMASASSAETSSMLTPQLGYPEELNFLLELSEAL